jgi:hypothetical protein
MGLAYDARMALHPLSAGFAEVAGAYERGRPEYAPAVVGAVAAELGIPAGGPVLDLAAGTGKLTRALLGVGIDVVAVEPQLELRELLTESVGGERVREGFADPAARRVGGGRDRGRRVSLVRSRPRPG